MTYDVNTYRMIDEQTAEDAVELAYELLPDEAEVAVLAFTGSRAFGWGGDKHDYDIHGWFALDGWFRQCHTDQRFDMTIRNIETLDMDGARLQDHQFNKYYDLSKPIYIHPEFDFEDYQSRITPDHVLHVYPYNISTQVSRLENSFTIRSACHTYKEIMIPLYFLETGKIESNIVFDINTQPGYGYEWLDKIAKEYREPSGVACQRWVDEEAVWDEIRELWERLTGEVLENTSWKSDYGPMDSSEMGGLPAVEALKRKYDDDEEEGKE